MTTVASRTFRSNPYRDAAQTWNAIVDLLTQGKIDPARQELLNVGGIAASLIADKAPENAPIIIMCDGPRTRVYCIYDENALDESAANENSLGFSPLKGEWSVSFPCQSEDLSWVQNALKNHSTRITARDLSQATDQQSVKRNQSETLTLNLEGFLGK